MKEKNDCVTALAVSPASKQNDEEILQSLLNIQQTTTPAAHAIATTMRPPTYSGRTNDDLASLVGLDNKLTRHILGNSFGNDGNRFDLLKEFKQR